MSKFPLFSSVCKRIYWSFSYVKIKVLGFLLLSAILDRNNWKGLQFIFSLQVKN